MTYETFCSRPAVADFAAWVIGEVGHQDGTGWRDSLERYRWAGYEFDLTLECRCRQGAALANAETSDEWAAACEHVREWSGSSNEFSARDLAGLQQTCAMLAYEPAEQFEHIHIRRTSTASKVYAARYPSRWVIYDSRLGLRLTDLVSRWWHHAGGSVASECLRFPVPPGRTSASPPDGFVRLNSDRQARLGFLYVSWLCRLIAVHLTEHDAPLPEAFQSEHLDEWTAQLAEMALFVPPA